MKKSISLKSLLLFSLTIPLAFLTSCGGDDSDEPAPSTTGTRVETLTISGTYGGDDGLSVDSQGAIYVSNLASGNGTTIYKVENGASTVLSNTFSAPMGHAFDSNDNLFVANDRSTTIHRIDAQGQVTEYLTDDRFEGGSIHVDTDGTLYHTVYSTNKVYKISPEKEITELASGGSLNVPFGITLDADKNIYAANFSNGVITKITPAGNTSTLATLPSFIGYITFADNKLYATGFTTHQIYEIELDGTFSVLIGTGISGTVDGSTDNAAFVQPNGIAASADGKTLYISQKNFTIRKVTIE